MLNFAALKEEYNRQRANLLESFPELADDPVALTDTLDGLTSLSDTLADFIRAAMDDDALAEALSSRMKDMAERKSRLQARADKRRAIALALMSAVEMPRVEMPEFTASPRMSPPKVVVTEEALLPDAFVRVTKAPDKVALREALARGENIPGAMLGNGHLSLSVRTK